MDAVTTVPGPHNEPPLHFAPGSSERTSLSARLDELGGDQVDLAMALGTRCAMGGGDAIEVVAPHRRKLVLGTMHEATAADVSAAIEPRSRPRRRARAEFDDRAAIFLKAADLLAGPWRETIDAATMLGQSKTCTRPTSTRPANSPTFRRFNVQFARDILAEQPLSPPGVWNRLDHRPLEGFVLAIRRSTSPRSPATCPRPRPSWATLLSGSRPRLRARRASPDRAPRCGRPAGRRHHHGHRQWRCGVGRGCVAPSRPRRHPLHRVDRNVSAPVAQRRRQHPPAIAATHALSARPAARDS